MSPFWQGVNWGVLAVNIASSVSVLLAARSNIKTSYELVRLAKAIDAAAWKILTDTLIRAGRQ